MEMKVKTNVIILNFDFGKCNIKYWHLGVKIQRLKKIQHRLFSLQSSPGSYCSEGFRQVGKLSVASTCVLPLNTNLLGIIQPVPGVLLGKLSEIGNGRIFRSDRAKTKEVWV